MGGWGDLSIYWSTAAENAVDAAAKIAVDRKRSLADTGDLLNASPELGRAKRQRKAKVWADDMEVYAEGLKTS